MQEETEFELDILMLGRENILFIWCLIIGTLGKDMGEFQKPELAHLLTNCLSILHSHSTSA